MTAISFAANAATKKTYTEGNNNSEIQNSSKDICGRFPAFTIYDLRSCRYKRADPKLQQGAANLPALNLHHV